MYRGHMYMSTLKDLFAPRDLTKGTPWKQIVGFALPMLLGNIAQQFYNTADSIIVGKYIGDNALAAVGSAFPILNLLMILFVGVRSEERRVGKDCRFLIRNYQRISFS